jgi:hypothetical protein
MKQPEQNYYVFVDKYSLTLDGERHTFYRYMDYIDSQYRIYTNSRTIAKPLLLRPKTEEEIAEVARYLWGLIDGAEHEEQAIHARSKDEPLDIEGLGLAGLWYFRFYTFTMDEERRKTHPQHFAPQWAWRDYGEELEEGEYIYEEWGIFKVIGGELVRQPRLIDAEGNLLLSIDSLR